MNNIDLVKFARSKIGTPYVYGMKGAVMTQDKYNQLKKQYPSAVWDSDISKVGTVCCDCSGLISWFTGKIRNSAGYKAAAPKVHPISTVSQAPIGALVWQEGHIGIYIGDGKYIAEDGSPYGCRENSISKAKFTHWFLCADIEYVKEDDEMVEESEIIVDGKKVPIRRILKDGTNYIAIRDIANSMGYEVGNQGNIAVLSKNELLNR